ncbi:surf-like protein [Exophiala xenobiotica]|uniref:SURF1-like protein n=1 Tax=Lithohypha guttulata TaxID=1690604 RepID=A0ABR0K1J5_9EURO|nr:surf-like protein [Lithohypha guttulata]KAK5312017.1 surf-like protein [Exophiala xenobiotica]
MSGTNSRLLNAIFSVTRPSLRTSRCRQRQGTKQARRLINTKPRSGTNADDPDFVSIVDAPPQIISTKKKHNKLGITVLALIPITAFVLGSWQVQRLDWKTKLIAKFEDRLVRPPLPLPPRIDPSVIDEFDYRRIRATGRYRHDREMLVGPRMHDGKDGYFVITPLEREGGSTILVNRGWVSKDQRFQQDRDPTSLPRHEITVSGLLREPWKKNMFTPNNAPEQGKFYFPDVAQMASHSGSEPIWIEETMTPSLLESYRREEKGIPIGRAPEVNLRNNHVQYIVTWYSLSAATALMLWMVLKKKPSNIAHRVRTSKEW